MRAMYTHPHRYDRPTYHLDDDAIMALAGKLLNGDGSWRIPSAYPELIGEPVDWKWGYTVGGARPGIKFPMAQQHSEDILRVFYWLKDLLRTTVYLDTGDTVGSWTDPDTGTLYLDVGSRHTSLKDAVKVAQDRNEKAIWDWGLFGTHTLTKDGGLRFDPAQEG